MKPVRFFTILFALGLFITAFTPVMPQSNSVVDNSITAFSAPMQGLDELALDTPLDSPLAFMASAPVVTLALDESLSSASHYSCSLVSQKPANWTRMGRRQYFDAKWTLKNVGTKNWGIHGIDVKFISFTGGAKMHTQGNFFDLPKETGPGKKISILVDMNAPRAKGYYSEQWGLFTGGRAFCRFSITINVNR
jgi:hypothetical protein